VLAPGASTARGGELEDVVAAAAERQPVGRHAVLLRQCQLEREAVGVRVAAEIGQRRADRRPRARRHARWVLVRRELDDLRGIEPVLARQLLDRLARLVRRDGANIRRRLERVGGLQHRRHEFDP